MTLIYLQNLSTTFVTFVKFLNLLFRNYFVITAANEQYCDIFGKFTEITQVVLTKQSIIEFLFDLFFKKVKSCVDEQSRHPSLLVNASFNDSF